MFDPDNKCQYTIYGKNLEYQKERNNGWCLICQPVDEEFEDKLFLIGKLVVEPIGDTKHIWIILR